jgi:hypothetical protein
MLPLQGTFNECRLSPDVATTYHVLCTIYEILLYFNYAQNDTLSTDVLQNTFKYEKYLIICVKYALLPEP